MQAYNKKYKDGTVNEDSRDIPAPHMVIADVRRNLDGTIPGTVPSQVFAIMQEGRQTGVVYKNDETEDAAFSRRFAPRALTNDEFMILSAIQFLPYGIVNQPGGLSRISPQANVVNGSAMNTLGHRPVLTFRQEDEVGSSILRAISTFVGTTTKGKTLYDQFLYCVRFSTQKTQSKATHHPFALVPLMHIDIMNALEAVLAEFAGITDDINGQTPGIVRTFREMQDRLQTQARTNKDRGVNDAWDLITTAMTDRVEGRGEEIPPLEKVIKSQTALGKILRGAIAVFTLLQDVLEDKEAFEDTQKVMRDYAVARRAYMTPLFPIAAMSFGRYSHADVMVRNVSGSPLDNYHPAASFPKQYPAEWITTDVVREKVVVPSEQNSYSQQSKRSKLSQGSDRILNPFLQTYDPFYSITTEDGKTHFETFAKVLNVDYILKLPGLKSFATLDWVQHILAVRPKAFRLVNNDTTAVPNDDDDHIMDNFDRVCGPEKRNFPGVPVITEGMTHYRAMLLLHTAILQRVTMSGICCTSGLAADSALMTIASDTNVIMPSLQGITANMQPAYRSAESPEEFIRLLNWTSVHAPWYTADKQFDFVYPMLSPVMPSYASQTDIGRTLIPGKQGLYCTPDTEFPITGHDTIHPRLSDVKIALSSRASTRNMACFVIHSAVSSKDGRVQKGAPYCYQIQVRQGIS